jgi:two-component system response regulator MprA
VSGTILVVDDDRGLQAALAEILEDEGYQVAIAHDGYHALDQLADLTPDLIVLDIGMPRMDGYAFAEELTRRGLRPHIPVLVLTADGRAQQKAARVQADGWLSKPFEIGALLGSVARLLGATPG